MKLSDGTEIRNEPEHRHMKFNGSGITEYVWLLSLDGMADESYGDTDYGYAARFGKRILWSNTAGFVDLAKYRNEDEAELVYRIAETEFLLWELECELEL